MSKRNNFCFSDDNDKNLGAKFTFEDMFSDEFKPKTFASKWVDGKRLASHS